MAKKIDKTKKVETSPKKTPFKVKAAPKKTASKAHAKKAAKKAAKGGDPFVWAPIVAEIISEIGTPEAYEAGVRLIRCLIRTGDLVTSVSPAQKTVPPTA